MMPGSERSEAVDNAANVDEREIENLRLKKRGAAVLIGVSTAATVATGVLAASISKRKFKQYFPSVSQEPESPETGVSLALKALCYSTILTIGIFSISIFCICKYFDVNSLDELRRKLRKPKNINPDERTEFESLSDFIQYLTKEYDRKKDEKK